MELRDYQKDVKQKILTAWASGATNVLAQLSTGAGKTVLFSNIIKEERGRSIAIAHRMELVSQISITLARNGVRHNIIAQNGTIRSIVSAHMSEFKRSYYDPNARCAVAGVDTLIRMTPEKNPWFNDVALVVQDEGHHPLKRNKWGAAAALFPNARGLYPTATPIRADGCGLGHENDGIMHELIVGPHMRKLINDGYLSDYKIYAPPNNLNLSNVTISASGDYSPPKLRAAVHESKITGCVVSHYLKFAAGKLGVTFAVDINAACEIAQEFRDAGVSAEVVSSKTPDALRRQIMKKFRNKEILQLVNVDLLGEGVDVPEIEVVIMARPTQSFSLFAQQFGRALRPAPGKTHAFIIDHVGNCERHGVPDDLRRTWSLDRREKRSRGKPTGAIPLRTCLNVECFLMFEAVKRMCPYCGFYSPPAERSAPEFVDGDLFELDEEVLAKLRGEVFRIDDEPKIPQHLDTIAQYAVAKRHKERQAAQATLREKIAQWAGVYKFIGCDDSEIYRRFYFEFGIDVMTAQTLNAKDAENLSQRIDCVSNRV